MYPKDLKWDKASKQQLKKLLGKRNRYYLMIPVGFLLVYGYLFLDNKVATVNAKVSSVDNHYDRDGVNQKIGIQYHHNGKVYKNTLYGKDLYYDGQFVNQEYNLKVGDIQSLEIYWLRPSELVNPIGRQEFPVIVFGIPLAALFIMLVSSKSRNKKDYDTIINGLVVQGNHLRSKVKNDMDNHTYHLHEYSYHVREKEYLAAVKARSDVFYNKVHVIYKKSQIEQYVVLEHLGDHI